MAAPISDHESLKYADCAILRKDLSDELEITLRLANLHCRTPKALLVLHCGETPLVVHQGIAQSFVPSVFPNSLIPGRGTAFLESRDTIADPRFDSSPLFSFDSGIRFYAAVSLLENDPQPGALCVMDRVPRKLDPQQRDALSLLARQTGRMIELYREAHQEQASRLRDEIALVSHELRTPLTSVMSALSYLTWDAEERYSEHARRMIRISLRNGERMMRLIEQLLEVQHAGSGKMEFHLQPVDLLPLIDSVIEAMLPFSQPCGVRYEVAAQNQKTCVVADPDRLSQVLMNLLSNATKFSPSGGCVQIRIQSREGGIRIEVIDQGPGIPEQFQSRIFQKFVQARHSGMKHPKGAGLGLSISKLMIESMRGSIGFQPGQDAGAVFYVDLPEHG